MAKIKKIVNGFGTHYWVEEGCEAIKINRIDTIKQLDAIPREIIDKMISELKTKTECTKNKDCSGINCSDVNCRIFGNYVIDIIEKYCNKEINNANHY